MRYEVTPRFYTNLVGLLGIAIEDNKPVEIDLVMGLLRNTEAGQETM
jgi:hypothetical protein